VPGPAPEAVLLNTAGGVTGGDDFDIAATVSDTSLTVTSQTAERIYRSARGAGRIRNRLTLGPASRLDWLPHETILFDGGRLDRRLDVDMADDATLWAVESLVLGRAAMGETVRAGFVSDQWRITRGGKRIYADGLRMGHRDPDSTSAAGIDRLVARTAILDGAQAMAFIVHVSRHAEELLPKARHLIAEWMARYPGDVRMAASAWNGILTLRLVTDTNRALKAALAFLLTELRASPLPRVWSL